MWILRSSMVRYLMVGVVNTIVGLSAIWLALRLLDASAAAANAMGYGVGFLCSFLLNRTWTFRHRGGASTGLIRYILVCLVAYVANLIVVLQLGEHFGRSDLVPQIAGMVTYTLLAYAGSRLYAFPISMAR